MSCGHKVPQFCLYSIGLWALCGCERVGGLVEVLSHFLLNPEAVGNLGHGGRGQ